MIKNFNTPILFLIFNRPDTTQIVFNQIKKIKPKKLFIAADGPRKDVLSDEKSCTQTRKIVDQIDWNCDLKLLFRQENLGCGKGVSSAITWFFDHVDKGIILEDDCVPDLSFFDYCSYFLDKYESEKEIMMISGTNYFFNKLKSKYSYFFSKYYSIWGWATWKRAWDLYDFNINSWGRERDDRINYLEEIYKKKDIVNFWIENFDKISKRKLDTWDIQWCYNCIFNNGLSITPINNLISNIGDLGSHSTGKSPYLRMPVKSFNFNVLEQNEISVNPNLDKITYKNVGVINKFPINKYYFLLRHWIKKTIFNEK